jgi:hypothetical protein
MRLLICSYENVSPHRFVEFWSSQWTDKDKAADNQYYNPNIGKPLTEERLKALFRWKNTIELSGPKSRSVEYHVSRLDDLKKLPADTAPSDFLSQFKKGGAIWRIFLLHCWSFWRGAKYPMYDQHVHRAMTFICEGSKEEISTNDREKIDTYLNKYIDFFRRFSECDPQKVDQALIKFGQFMKFGQRDFRGLSL